MSPSYLDYGFDKTLSKESQIPHKFSPLEARRIIPASSIKIQNMSIPKLADLNDGIAEISNVNFTNFFNDDDASITYAGTWSQQAVNPDLGGTRYTSSIVGDSFTIKFTGEAIGLYFERGSDTGKISVAIDGGSATTYDCYAATYSLCRAIRVTLSSLLYKEHTVVCTVETKNGSSSSNAIYFEGYTLFPNDGIKIQQLSHSLIGYTETLVTDGNGYATSATATVTGYSTYQIVGLILSGTTMSDATLTDPKLAWSKNSFYLYNGAATTSYDVGVTLALSKAA